MTIVVTGASGHLGRLVVESLLERGVAPADIRALGRSEQKLAELAARGVQTAAIDFDEPETLAPAFEGAEALLLVSGSEVGKRIPQHTNAIDAAVKAGVGRIVYTSAPHATDTSLVLAPDHAATEKLLAESGLPVTILRNNWYTENYAGLIDTAAETGAHPRQRGSRPGRERDAQRLRRGGGRRPDDTGPRRCRVRARRRRRVDVRRPRRRDRQHPGPGDRLPGGLAGRAHEHPSRAQGSTRRRRHSWSLSTATSARARWPMPLERSAN